MDFLLFSSLLFFALFTFSVADLSAQGIQITSRISDSWDNPATWDCNCIPTINDNVIIANGTTVAFNSDGSCNSIRVGQGAAALFTMGSKPGNMAPVNLVVRTNVVVNANAAINLVGNRRTHTLTIGGDLLNYGTITLAVLTPNKPECDVIMNKAGSQTIGGTLPVYFNSLIISAGSTTATTVAGQTVRGLIRCNGTLASDGNITLLSSSFQTALIDGSGTGQVTGIVKMQRYLPLDFGYKYLSSPFQAATVNELSEEVNLGASFPALYRYDESRATPGWISYVNPANLLNPLEGYAANFGATLLPITAEMKGIVNNGPFSVTLYNHNNTYTKGFNLIGNPYPSPLNWDSPSGWTKTNIDNALYYFAASTTDEYGGTYSTYVNGISSDGLATAVIPSMQGFFVHVSDGTYPVTASLGLTNSVRVTDLVHAFIKSEEKSQGRLVRLSAVFVDDTASADPTVIYFNEKGTTGFDRYLDALKMMNTDYNVSNLYSLGSDGTRLSINALQESSEWTPYRVPLGLKMFREGMVSFRITGLDSALLIKEIYISDETTGAEQDLLENNEYRIYLKSGNFENRFFLNLLMASEMSPVTNSDSDIFSAYSSAHLLKVFITPSDQTGTNTLTITGMTGQIMQIYRDLGSGYHEFNPGLKEGLYIVTCTSGRIRSSKKILVKNP